MIKLEEITPEILNQYYKELRLITQRLSRMNKGYYIYYHTDPRTYLPMYVGKGCDGRAWQFYGRNKKHKAWIKELLKLGLEPIVDIGYIFLDEKEAYKIEEHDIKFLKNLGLAELNIAPGGMGCPSEFVKKPIVCLNTNKIYSSTKEAADDLKILPKRINSVLKGTKKSYKGYVFRYINEELNKKPDELRQEKKNLKGKNGRKAILCIETDKKYISIREAARELGVSDSSIHSFLSGKLSSVRGFTFKRL